MNGPESACEHWPSQPVEPDNLVTHISILIRGGPPISVSNLSHMIGHHAAFRVGATFPWNA